jgi:hypothetical protein
MADLSIRLIVLSLSNCMQIEASICMYLEEKKPLDPIIALGTRNVVPM